MAGHERRAAPVGRDLLAAGAQDHGAGRILFPRALVEDAIAKAASTFILHGRDESRSIEVGGNKVYFGANAIARSIGAISINDKILLK